MSSVGAQGPAEHVRKKSTSISCVGLFCVRCSREIAKLFGDSMVQTNIMIIL